MRGNDLGLAFWYCGQEVLAVAFIDFCVYNSSEKTTSSPGWKALEKTKFGSVRRPNYDEGPEAALEGNYER